MTHNVANEEYRLADLLQDFENLEKEMDAAAVAFAVAFDGGDAAAARRQHARVRLLASNIGMRLEFLTADDDAAGNAPDDFYVFGPGDIEQFDRPARPRASDDDDDDYGEIQF